MFDYSELIGLLNECESLHDKLKLAARKALASIDGAHFESHVIDQKIGSALGILLGADTPTTA